MNTRKRIKDVLGHGHFASMIGFQLPKKASDMEVFMIETMINTKKGIGGINSKKLNFQGTIDTDGVAVCFHYKSSSNLAPVQAAGDEHESRVEGMQMDEIAGVDPGRRNMVTLLNGSVRMLRRDKYRKMSRQRENLIRQQRWDNVLQAETHQLSQNTSKVGSIEAFAQHMDVQRTTCKRRFEANAHRAVCNSLGDAKAQLFFLLLCGYKLGYERGMREPQSCCLQSA